MNYQNPTRRDVLRLALATAAAFYFPGCRPAERIAYKKTGDVMTDRLFDESYNFDASLAWGIAKELYPLTLQQSVDKGIIRTDTDGDLTLPLGVSKNARNVDFERAMRAMWNTKLERREFSKRSYQEQKERIERFREKAVAQVRRRRPYSLRQYKDNEAVKGIELLKELHDGTRVTHGENARAFMDAVVKNIDPDVLIGYNITEMLPRVVLRNGRNQWINPAFKAWYLDRLFKEAGTEFLTYYPARFDPYVSYSPFQITKYAMGEVARMNRLLPQAKRVPEFAAGLNTLQEHVNAAVLFAYANWSYVLSDLGRADLLRQARKAIDNLDGREMKIFVSELTATMHNLPASRGAIIRHLRKPQRKMHLGVMEQLDTTRRRYGRSSVEASLIMDWFGGAESRHGRK